MTAEIAVMNKLGVALAADSAVTIEYLSRGDLKKIYNTTNKLFRLSKYHPIGIMVYGNAELLRVPWEVTIKVYRERLGKKKFDTLSEYCSDFVGFLEGFFTSTNQEEALYGMIAGYFKRRILNEIDEEVRKATDERGKINQAEIEGIVQKVVDTHHKALSEADRLDCFPAQFARQIRRKHKALLDKAINTVFEKLPLTPGIKKQLFEMAVCICTNSVFSPGTSGIVIAGFGEKEIFPSLFAIAVDGIINGRLKHAVSHSESVGANNQGIIIPFAQQEMVVTFMEGIDPEYAQLIEGYLGKIFEEYPHKIIENMADLDWKEEEKEKFLGILTEQGQKMLQEFKEDLVKFKRNTYTEPIISNVGSLPKDELAAMAESLVNLTSFKRRVSMDAETVGGPIDVAVISKGDGFIWIKRKHYFTAELNHHFFENYYSRSSER